jgi:oligopeptide/dipeptide ABC transporter ATP-binding protein
VLSGELPSPSKPPSGCVFRTRCSFAIGACAETVPALQTVADGRRVACLRWSEIG